MVMDPNRASIATQLDGQTALLLQRLAERFRWENALAEHPDPETKQHRLAQDRLEKLAPADGDERNVLRQLAWLNEQLHQRDLDELEPGDRVAVTLRAENRPWMGCSQMGSVVPVIRVESRDPFTDRTTGLLVSWPGGQHYLLRGVELRDVRLMQKRTR